MSKQVIGAFGALLLAAMLLMASALPVAASGKTSKTDATATPSSGWATSTPMPDGGWD